MQLLLFSISLFIFSLEVASDSEPYYTITVPAQMVYPSEEKACVTIAKLKGELRLKMELKKDQKSVLVTEDTINTPTYFHCYSFELPNVEDEKEVWFFHVSAHGDTLNINQTKKILLIQGTHMTFIQTDKPNYKPGQTVNFRILTLDRNFHAKNDKYPLVELIDPNSNRIAQWLDVSPHQGIADLSFSLAKELSLGDYSIKIPNAYRATFTVSEYVLKRFSLKTDVPRSLFAADKAFDVKVCGSYTYGKPVSGSVDISVCKDKRRVYKDFIVVSVQKNTDLTSNCQQFTGVHTEDNGCVSKEIDLAFYNFSSTSLNDYLGIQISVTDDISGSTEMQSIVAYILPYIFVEFEKVPEFYQKGIPFTAELKIIDGKSQPIVNQTVYLVLGFEEEDLNLTSVTNENGIAAFLVDTSTWNDMVSVHGMFTLDDKPDQLTMSRAFAWLHPLYSESNSYLTVEADTSSLSCDSDQDLTVQYYINTSELDHADEQLHFFYFYVSKGLILSHGEYDINISNQSPGSVLRGKFTLKIPIGAEYYPNFIFVVYTILENGDIPSFRKEFKTPLCLKNKVTLKFSKKPVRPGEKVNLEVQADSGSLCSVRSVDKGLLLNTKHETIRDSKMMLEMMSLRLAVNKRGIPYTIEDFERYPCLRNKKDPQAEIQEAAWYHGDADVYMMFKHSNLKIFTNTKIRKPVVCAAPSVIRRLSNQPHKTVEMQKPTHSKSEEKIKEPVKRTFFPETWLYDLVSVGPQGRTVVNLTTPHSITTWETDAFCLGKSGFGEISDVGLTTFQPYFIDDLLTPYSVVQGEEFTITAHVSSYIKSCLMVFVSLSELNYPTVGKKDQSQCICEGQAASFMWNVSASKPGDLRIHVSSTSRQLEGGCADQHQAVGTDPIKDSIEKTILVKNSGVLEEKIDTFLLCPSGDTIRRTVTLEVPEKLMPGSDQAVITVLGNLMGSAISNIGEHLEVPFGSGEHNLRNFIPISHILKYLENTKKLTPKKKEKAITYLTNGYLSQLMFKKADGSYSVFHGVPSSAWLTAFTVKSLIHAKDIIYIEEKHIEDAIKWLSSLQQPSGCFKEVGKFFNNYLVQQEADNNVTLTAYIAIALMEHGQVYDGLVVENALRCLKNAVDDVRTTYTQSLLAYVFTLSNDDDLRKHMLEVLDKAAISKDGSKYLAAHKYDYGDIEISSYYLLALLSHQPTSQRDLEEASPVVDWIIKQQRPQGGFYSTQDTAIALQAMTKYAKATYTEKPEVTVSVRSLSGFSKQFHVDEKNSLLTQRETLPDIPGEYTVTAAGTGCAYIQTHLKYHTGMIKSNAYFNLTATTQPSVCTIEAKTGLDIIVEASYSGAKTVTSRAILEVHLLSGFLPNKKGIKQLKNNPIVKRTEITSDKVIIFLEKLTHEAETLSFSIKQESYVKNLQSAKVKIYDHYAPDEHAVTEYNSPCSTESEKDP